MYSDLEKVVAAVSIAGPIARMKMDQIENLASIVGRMAEKLTGALREEDVHFE